MHVGLLRGSKSLLLRSSLLLLLLAFWESFGNFDLLLVSNTVLMIRALVFRICRGQLIQMAAENAVLLLWFGAIQGNDVVWNDLRSFVENLSFGAWGAPELADRGGKHSALRSRPFRWSVLVRCSCWRFFLSFRVVYWIWRIQGSYPSLGQAPFSSSTTKMLRYECLD